MQRKDLITVLRVALDDEGHAVKTALPGQEDASCVALERRVVRAAIESAEALQDVEECLQELLPDEDNDWPGWLARVASEWKRMSAGMEAAGEVERYAEKPVRSEYFAQITINAADTPEAPVLSCEGHEECLLPDGHEGNHCTSIGPAPIHPHDVRGEIRYLGTSFPPRVELVAFQCPHSAGSADATTTTCRECGAKYEGGKWYPATASATPREPREVPAAANPGLRLHDVRCDDLDCDGRCVKPPTIVEPEACPKCGAGPSDGCLATTRDGCPFNTQPADPGPKSPCVECGKPAFEGSSYCVACSPPF